MIDWLIDCVNFCLVDSCFVFFQCNTTYPTISERKQSTKNSCNSAGREYTDMFKTVILVQGNARKRWWMLVRKFWVSENFDATQNILEAFVSLKVLLLCVSFLSKYYCGAFFSTWVCELHQGCHGQGKVWEFSKTWEKIFDIVRVSEKSGNSVFPFIVHKFSSLFWNAFSFGKD